ncbi:hypothetical protein [Vannielia sp.]|uniref:hypothetical protein n=1 Tax=Vannielia sp. TaxID=2813045 RepID=UPI00260A2E69|nr:hypothetical protein [Vannielia sp.]MDF1871049.1 hypothetical protein [Vannielia sp.]
MFATLSRLLLICTLLLGLVFPKATAVLAGLGLAGGETIVICTGDGLITLRIAPDGTPMEVPDATAEAEQPCTMSHAALPDVSARSGEARILRPLPHLLPAEPLALHPLQAHHEGAPRGPPPAFG